MGMSMRFRLALTAAISASLAVAASAGAVNPQQAGLQVALRAQGLYAGPIDAIAGPLTVAAVRSFQRSHGLKQTGIADGRTAAAEARGQSWESTAAPRRNRPGGGPDTRPSTWADKTAKATPAETTRMMLAKSVISAMTDRRRPDFPARRSKPIRHTCLHHGSASPGTVRDPQVPMGRGLVPAGEGAACRSRPPAGHGCCPVPPRRCQPPLDARTGLTRRLLAASFDSLHDMGDPAAVTSGKRSHRTAPGWWPGPPPATS